ncbi:MAG TPA: hypothetical protein VGF50_09025 [Caulobacteraceae bacterium]|jgi:hypothetical protein
MEAHQWLYERALESLERAASETKPVERARLLLAAIALRDLADDYEPDAGRLLRLLH